MDREEKETLKFRNPLGEGDLSDVDASDDNSALPSGDDNDISCDDQDDD